MEKALWQLVSAPGLSVCKGGGRTAGAWNGGGFGAVGEGGSVTAEKQRDTGGSSPAPLCRILCHCACLQQSLHWG